jgi:hypothetical protein
MNDRTVRWGGVAGIVFVILILITVFSGGSVPKPDDSVQKIQKYFVDHRGGLLLSNFLGLVAIPFALWFGVVLRETVRGDRLSNAFGTASLAGLIVTAPMAMAGGALQAAPVFVKGAASQIDANTLRLVFDVQTLAFIATSGGIVAFVLGAAAAIQRTRVVLPAYTMWLALLAVAGNIVTMLGSLGAGASGLGIFGVATFGLFILVTGATMAAGKASAGASIS